MVRQAMSRRQFLAVTGVTGVGGLAGCSGGGGEGTEESGPETDSRVEETEPESMGGTDTPGETPAEETPTEAETETASEGGPVTVSGSLVGPSGSPVTSGQIDLLSESERPEIASPEDDGTFSAELTSGVEYTMLFARDAFDYSVDGLPDVYVIDELSLTSDTDLGEVSLPEAYEVDVVVETADGEDLSGQVAVLVSHTNNGTTGGKGLTTNDPIELTGEVTFNADYEGETVEKTVTITEAQSVTLTF